MNLSSHVSIEQADNGFLAQLPVDDCEQLRFRLQTSRFALK